MNIAEKTHKKEVLHCLMACQNGEKPNAKLLNDAILYMINELYEE